MDVSLLAPVPVKPTKIIDGTTAPERRAARTAIAAARHHYNIVLGKTIPKRDSKMTTEFVQWFTKNPTQDPVLLLEKAIEFRTAKEPRS